MALAVADRWFEMRRIDDDITLLWEPHVVPLMRCNIWHLRGRDRDLMIDTGMGVGSLREAARDLLEKPVTAVATHTHVDHVGGHHEFEDNLVHAAEADDLRNPKGRNTLRYAEYDPAAIAMLARAGYVLDGDLITALPHAGYDMDSFATLPATVGRAVEDGEVVDLGDRHLEVLHLPGHSPGSMGLWEAETGTLFSGDAIYDGPLLDELGHSNIADYIRTMHRLRALPVSVVHGGHDPSFGRARLVELVDAYLARRETAERSAAGAA